jgi:hypothetical protein
MNFKVYNYSPIKKEYPIPIRQTHLLFDAIIYVGDGLYLTFISAWKSGIKPSANTDIKSKKRPIFYDANSYSCFTVGSNNLKTIMPIVANSPTMSFFGPNLSFLSVTLEHKEPTRITERTLQLLAKTPKGKFVRYTA